MKPANAHPADIIASLRKQGGSLSELAKAQKLHHSTFGHALRRCIPAANLAIAKFLDTSTHTLWPEWFDARGQRRKTRRTPSSHKASARKRPNSDSSADRKAIS